MPDVWDTSCSATSLDKSSQTHTTVISLCDDLPRKLFLHQIVLTLGGMTAVSIQ